MLLKTQNLTKKFGALTAVDGLNLDIKKGELFGLLGPNGAGKSTTISMLSTLVKPTEGMITFKGEDIVKNPKVIQPKMGVVPQNIALYTTLTGMDNLIFWGKAYGLKGDRLKTRIDEVTTIIGMGNRLKDRVDKYSGGMQRRLNIGVALLHEPELLIMDEPTVGIDPQSRNHILETVKVLNQSGMTIIYTSHYMEEVEALCDRIAIMDHGKIIVCGTKAELLEHISEANKISIRFSEVNETLMQRIHDIKGIDQVVVTGESIVFYSLKSSVVKVVFDAVQDIDIEVVSVEIEQPNLESVFLNLTGKALRD